MGRVEDIGVLLHRLTPNPTDVSARLDSVLGQRTQDTLSAYYTTHIFVGHVNKQLHKLHLSISNFFFKPRHFVIGFNARLENTLNRSMNYISTLPPATSSTN